MNLHDHYAAAALTGMLAYSHVDPMCGNYHENSSVIACAVAAHAYAEAMLVARPEDKPTVDTLALLDEAQAIEQELRKKITLLHDATITLRNALAGPRTTAQDYAYKDACRILDQLGMNLHQG